MTARHKKKSPRLPKLPSWWTSAVVRLEREAKRLEAEASEFALRAAACANVVASDLTDAGDVEEAAADGISNLAQALLCRGEARGFRNALFDLTEGEGARAPTAAEEELRRDVNRAVAAQTRKGGRR